METRKINLLGRSVNIRFSMAAQLAYEEVMGKPFEFGDINSSRVQYALCAAAIETTKQDDPLPDDFYTSILHDATAAEIATLNEAVAESLQEFYGIPSIVKRDDGGDNEEEAKNP